MKLCIALFTNRTSSWLFQNIYRAESRRGLLSPRKVNAWLRHQQFLAYPRTDITNQSPTLSCPTRMKSCTPGNGIQYGPGLDPSTVRLVGRLLLCHLWPTVGIPPTCPPPACTAILVVHPVTHVEITFPSFPYSLLWSIAQVLTKWDTSRRGNTTSASLI